MWTVLTTFALSSLSLASQDFGGWKLEKYQAHQREMLIDSDTYLLTPPDEREAITIRGSLALQIISGALTAQQVYEGRDRHQPTIPRTNIEIKPFYSATNQNQYFSSQLIKASSIDSSYPANKDSTQTYDPKSDQPWPYNWEENVKACEGTLNMGNVPIDTLNTLRLSQKDPHPHCNEKDVEEAARRTFHNVCNRTIGTENEVPFPGNISSIEVSEIWTMSKTAQEHHVFYASARCKTNILYYGVFSFAKNTAPVDKCWVCSQSSIREGYTVNGSFISRVPLENLRKLDLTKPSRSSPQMSEFPETEIPGYWKK